MAALTRTTALLLALGAPAVAQEGGKETSRPGDAPAGFAISLGKERVEFFVEGNPAVKSPLVVSLHRNESTAFPIVREILSSQQGRFVGIRTPWTLASDEVWTRTHRFGGRLMFATGVLGGLAIAAGAPPMPVFVTVMAAVLYPIFYSYWIWRQVGN
mgnify:CR=1 FL=1